VTLTRGTPCIYIYIERERERDREGGERELSNGGTGISQSVKCGTNLSIKARDFSLLRNYYICSAPQPSFCPIGAGFLSQGQSGRGVNLASYLHLVRRVIITGAILLPPPLPCHLGVETDKFTVLPLPVIGFLWNLVLREALLKSVDMFQLWLEYDGSNDCLT
jgi:hypothetical protein